MNKAKKKYLKSKLKILAIGYVFLIFTLIACTNPAKAEKLTRLTNLNNPTDIAISSDGSFFYTVDTINNPFVRRYNFSQGEFSQAETITITNTGNLAITNNTTSLPPIKISLSKNNKKLLVVKKQSGSNPNLISIIDTTSKSKKTLQSATPANEQIDAAGFIEAEGKKIIVCTSTSSTFRILIVNTETDIVETTFSIPDIARSIVISPNYKKAIITYKNLNAESITIYDIELQKLNTINAPQKLFFKIDDFISQNNFDTKGFATVLSSASGSHVLHHLDLLNERLIVRILDNDSEGQSISTISRDGLTGITIGTFNIPKTETGGGKGYTIYKVALENDYPILAKSVTFDEIVIQDVEISPKQSKIYILATSAGKKILRVLNLDDLSFLYQTTIANDDSKSFLYYESSGLYALTTNRKQELSISAISNFEGGNLIIKLTCPQGDLNECIINGFKEEGISPSSDKGGLINIATTGSIELANAPTIEKGEEGTIKNLPNVDGVGSREFGKTISVPRGCAFATIAELSQSKVTIPDEEKNNRFSTLLIDKDGKTYLIGFAFFRESALGLKNNTQRENLRFQTTSGKDLQLLTILSIPENMPDGKARIEILNKDKSLLTVPLEVAPSIDVKTRGKKTGKKHKRSQVAISKPEVDDPVTAKIIKADTGKPKLKIKVKGKNFLKKFAIINGQPLRLGTSTFTNITFVPEEGITPKRIKFNKKKKNKLVVKNTIESNIEPGIKLFNIITPKCADVGAVIIPEVIQNGEIEATAYPENLILKGEIINTPELENETPANSNPNLKSLENDDEEE